MLNAECSRNAISLLLISMCLSDVVYGSMRLRSHHVTRHRRGSFSTTSALRHHSDKQCPTRPATTTATLRTSPSFWASARRRFASIAAFLPPRFRNKRYHSMGHNSWNRLNMFRIMNFDCLQTELPGTPVGSDILDHLDLFVLACHSSTHLIAGVRCFRNWTGVALLNSLAGFNTSPSPVNGTQSLEAIVYERRLNYSFRSAAGRLTVEFLFVSPQIKSHFR